MKINLNIIAFLVTWKLASWMPEVCPDAGKTNVYGNPLIEGCLVNHGHYVYEEHSRIFDTFQEVENFVDNAPDNVKDIKVEEIKD